jgi:methyl-accepting chemotaxis protein
LYDISQALSVAAKVQGSASTTEELETAAEELETLTDELDFASETLEELAAELDSGFASPTLEEYT